MRTFVKIQPATRPATISDFRQMEETLNRLFGMPLAEEFMVTTESSRQPIPMDIHVTPTSVVITAGIPGIDPSQVDIQIENQTLTLRTERAPRIQSEESRPVRVELRSGQLGRSIELPANLDYGATEASFHNGLVTITLPRIAEVKPEPLRIPVRTVESNQPSIPVIEASAETSPEA